jgi:hypothetical protein
MKQETPFTSSVVVAGQSLPCDCPSSTLVAQVVGVASGDEDLTGLLWERQQWSVCRFSIFQQNQ